MREAAKEATVLFYAPGSDPFLEELVKNANKVFYLNEGPRAEARIVAIGQSEDANEPEHAGGIHVILRRKR